jgi:hypothetical protein
MASKFVRGAKLVDQMPPSATRTTYSRKPQDFRQEARAELLRERITLEVELLEPRFQAVTIPEARLNLRLRPMPLTAALRNSEVKYHWLREPPSMQSGSLVHSLCRRKGDLNTIRVERFQLVQGRADFDYCFLRAAIRQRKLH